MKTREPCMTREEDRAGGASLIDVFSLGDICLNAFPTPDEPNTTKVPLTLAYSPESKLVQLRHTVDPELMFREYWYHSGTNESMAEHLREIVIGTAGIYTQLKAGDTVVDIGCNDGTLLGFYSNAIRKVGYDPARIKPKNCDVFVNDFFGSTSSTPSLDASFLEGKVKIVTSIAMFYDIDDPVAFAMDVASILDDDGVWIIEMHYLPVMLEKNEVDAICHEHLCYYSLTSLNSVLAEAGLTAVDVSFNNTNGGSMLVHVKKHGFQSKAVLSTLIKEAHMPLIDQLIDFANRVKNNRDALRSLLTDLTAQGKKVYGYGASTKGNTLLQYCGITPELVSKIAERNSDKWGRETVGTRIPIVSEEQMRLEQPDYLLVLPYHFIDAFKKREHEFLERGGRFIIPIPTPQVVA